MIILHKLNGNEFSINAELIETLEGGKETVISLATGNRYVVRETTGEITKKVVEYRRKVNAESVAQNPIKGFERA